MPLCHFGPGGEQEVKHEQEDNVGSATHMGSDLIQSTSQLIHVEFFV